ncbi:hypothetical protein JCM3774_003306 [Rhodotorula dairenensis]
MDKFGSAFSQAKNYAEKGRSQITTQFDKIDKAVPIGHQRPRAGSSAASGGAASPSLHAGSGTHTPTSLHSTRPPPPPIRNASISSAAGGVAPPAPPPRNHRASPAAAGGGVFTAMIHDSAEKEAFFTLLDEYFAARPQFAALFSTLASPSAPASASALASPTPPPVAPAASRPIPATPAPAPGRGLGTATALYDFEGAQADDLAFSTGDVITVTKVGTFSTPRAE